MGETTQIRSAPRVPWYGSLMHLAAGRSDFLLRAAETLGDVYWLHLGRERVLVLGNPEDASRVLTNHHDNYSDKGGGTGFRRTALPFRGFGLATWDAMDGEWRRRRGAFRRLYSMPLQDGLAGLDLARRVGASECSAVEEAVHSEVIAEQVLILLGMRPPADELNSAGVHLRGLTDYFWMDKLRPGLIFAAKRTHRSTRALEDQIDDWCSRSMSEELATPFLAEAAKLGLSADAVRDEVLAQLLSSGLLYVPLMWGLHRLAVNPDVQQKVRDALVVTPDVAEHKSTYLSWTVREILRLCPPVYWLQRRAQQCDRLGGHEIPAGTRLVIFVPRVHQHPDYWPEPRAFRPERFAAPSDAAKRYWMPFGVGPRTCIAREYTIASIARILSNVIKNYEVGTSSGEPTLVPSFNLTLRPPPRLQFKPVSPKEFADAHHMTPTPSQPEVR